ncbi:MAG: superoxide dismutase [Gemmatimonadota bacterium]
MARYALPDLPYDYAALEPWIDEQTMRLHHDIHHQGYVNGANAALEKLEQAREAGDFAAVKAVSRDLAFNASGHLLHTIFWPNMAPEGQGGEPADALADELARSFGGVDDFKAHFSAAAKGVEGSGWGILAWEREGGHLVVLQAEKHQNLTAQGCAPILVLDVWEHAYYLKYQNKRAAYVDAWWNVVNWNDVAARFDAVR